MARVIICDRCKNTIEKEKDIFSIKFSPLPKNIADSHVEYELCQRCFDAMHQTVKTAPPQAVQWKAGD